MANTHELLEVDVLEKAEMRGIVNASPNFWIDRRPNSSTTYSATMSRPVPRYARLTSQLVHRAIASYEASFMRVGSNPSN